MTKNYSRLVAILAISAAALGGMKSYNTFGEDTPCSLFIDGVAAKAESDETAKDKNTNPIIQIKETEKTIVEKTIVYYKATLDGKIVVVSSEAEATFTKETITTTTIPVKYKSTVCEGGEDTPCTPTQWVEVED